MTQPQQQISLASLKIVPLTRLARRAAVVAGMLCVAPMSVMAQRVVTVVASDTALEASPTVPAGLITFELALRGNTRRELVVHRVPAGSVPDRIARQAAGRPASWFERWSFGGPGAPADSVGTSRATMELRPGRYVLVSYEVDASGRPRRDHHLWRELTVIAASALIAARFDNPDLTVKVKDARIDVAGTVRRGRRAIQVENVGGRPHEVMIARLKPGRTVDDVRRWSRDREDDAPVVYVGGLTPMSSGMTAQTRLVLQAGTHVILCPMRDVHARSHDHERGVLATFVVT
ncbi:MAG TPA: hypothetical protein VFZ21_15195 [Gemmatimonadaceae bacterium]|nr:hypothetical protein [Gemmatimonadaceae bacterium]